LVVKQEEMDELGKQYEQTQVWMEKEKSSFTIEKKAMEGMIQILKVQIKQLKDESKHFENLLHQTQLKDEKLIRGDHPIMRLQSNNQSNHPRNGNATSPPQNEPESYDQYTFHKITTAKQLLDKQILDLLGDKSITEKTHKRLDINLSKYHEEITKQFRLMESELQREKTVSHLLRSELQIEHQNEDLLVETVTSLQDQINRMSDNSADKFSIAVLDIPTSSTVFSNDGNQNSGSYQQDPIAILNSLQSTDRNLKQQKMADSEDNSTAQEKSTSNV